MDRQTLIHMFTILLLAGGFAFYVGKHLDRQFNASSGSNPFAPFTASFR